MRILDALEDWEIVEDDGFIYKRRKREGVVHSAVDDCETDQESKSLQRKKEVLLQTKQAYHEELKRWEELLAKQEQLAASVSTPPPSVSTNSPVLLLGDGRFEPYEELQHQVQEHEFFIKHHSNFCDQAEHICFLLDEMKRNTLELPTPRQIFP